ncbi:transglutaminase family protein [Parachlamydia acanthamoebae]|jgi:regulator of sirC expression with transglutaminase-like and TPR domain|uniref:transglutaminase family protein n=1 Tax=Parachlamydia acanthamoebae TaxID=83552 RepID=UPI0024E1FD82|nr:transglutaminase family protein [Parachlamydia acanthamoebae]
MTRIFLFLALFCLSLCMAASPLKIRALFRSLDPKSITQHLALYELYPDSVEGQLALKKAWELLEGSPHSSTPAPLSSIDPSIIHALIGLVNKQADETAPQLSLQELQLIDRLASKLPNRKLKGFYATTEAEVLNLPTEEVDLANGLFLSHLEDENKDSGKVYQAMMDLMALQILAKLPPNATPLQKISAINAFIFFDMGFRFPPHSSYAKDIDLYTFLPSVLDSRRGVCLGVSLLYICLAQRLSLPIEMVTPPGHIYVRYNDGQNKLNIETTARGIHMPCEEYLGIDTRALQERTVKEVIGLAHFNQAAAYLRQNQYEKTLICYQKAQPYLPHDMLLKELTGYTHLFLGNFDEGKQLLEEVKDHLPDHAVTKENMAEDYLNGAADVEGIKTIFMEIDESRDSLLKKKEALEKIVEKYPKFRAGIFSLASTHLQLHRSREALYWLNVYHSLHPNDPTVEYYLTVLCMERCEANQAWEHLLRAEKMTEARAHFPRALKEVRQALNQRCPI